MTVCEAFFSLDSIGGGFFKDFVGATVFSSLSSGSTRGLSFRVRLPMLNDFALTETSLESACVKFYQIKTGYLRRASDWMTFV